MFNSLRLELLLPALIDGDLFLGASIAAEDPPDQGSQGDGARCDRYVSNCDLGHRVFRMRSVRK